MREQDPSTLWRYSAYERGEVAAPPPGTDGKSVLATTLVAELRQLHQRHRADDVLEVFAACVRQNESAQLLLRHRALLWPVTLFPARGLYHVKRPILPTLEEGNADLEIVGVEAPTLKAPSALVAEQAEELSRFHPLPPLLWALALVAPRAFLLPEIAGRAAYRLAPDFVPEPAALVGALGPALRRLRTEISPLRAIARWPGMDVERSMRLLNGVYLQSGLMVLRTHPAARDDVPSTKPFSFAGLFRR